MLRTHITVPLVCWVPVAPQNIKHIESNQIIKLTMTSDAFSSAFFGLLTSDLQLKLVLLEICVHNMSLGIWTSTSPQMRALQTVISSMW